MDPEKLILKQPLHCLPQLGHACLPLNFISVKSWEIFLDIGELNGSPSNWNVRHINPVSSFNSNIASLLKHPFQVGGKISRNFYVFFSDCSNKITHWFDHLGLDLIQDPLKLKVKVDSGWADLRESFVAINLLSSDIFPSFPSPLSLLLYPCSLSFSPLPVSNSSRSFSLSPPLSLSRFWLWHYVSTMWPCLVSCLLFCIFCEVRCKVSLHKRWHFCVSLHFCLAIHIS